MRGPNSRAGSRGAEMEIDHGLAPETPIETMIDCLRMKRFDWERDDLPAIAHSPVKIRALMPDGSMIEDMASSLNWRDLKAYAAREGEMAQCYFCDNFEPASELSGVIGVGGMICQTCENNVDWDEY